MQQSRKKNYYANPGSYKVTEADADFAMQMRERHSESSVWQPPPKKEKNNVSPGCNKVTEVDDESLPAWH